MKPVVDMHRLVSSYSCIILSKPNSQAVKKECGTQGEKRCEIQGGDQEMAAMVG